MIFDILNNNLFLFVLLICNIFWYRMFLKKNKKSKEEFINLRLYRSHVAFWMILFCITIKFIINISL